MSLTSLCLRLVTRQALLGATYAGPRIYDSAITPLDQTAIDERDPLIIVTIEGDEGACLGLDLMPDKGTIDLVFDFVVANAVSDDDGTTTIIIPHTDDGIEATLDLMRRQAWRALQVSRGPWTELWRKLVFRIDRVTSIRGADTQKGIRFAARRVTVRLEPVADPGFDEAPPGFWTDVVNAILAVPDLAGLGKLIQDEIANATQAYAQGVPAFAGLSAKAIAAIGLNPDYTQPVTQVTVDASDPAEPARVETFVVSP